MIARIETLGCRERKSSTRRGGASSLVWKDRNLGKLVVLNSVSHTKPVEVVSRERSVSCSRSCDVPNRSGWKGVFSKFPSIVRLVKFQVMGVETGGKRTSM